MESPAHQQIILAARIRRTSIEKVVKLLPKRESGDFWNFLLKKEKYVAMSAKPKKMGSARRKSFFMFVCLFVCFYPIF